MGNSKVWRVTLEKIVWDDGKGDYDVSDLPKQVTMEIVADDAQEAIDLGLERMTDAVGFLIESSEASAERR